MHSPEEHDIVKAQKMPFQPFLEEYMYHLCADDQPKAYIAYCRAEADFEARAGRRRFKNYESFTVAKSQYLRRKRLNKKT